MKHLRLDSRSSNYGFDFRVLEINDESGNLLRRVPRIFRVEIGMSAHLAGLRDGDYILEINGESTELMEHETVEKKLFQSLNEVDLVTVSDLGNKFNSLED